MNADELFQHLSSIEAARAAGAKGNGVVRSHVLSGVEYALVGDSAERLMRAQWKRRSKGGPTPLLVIADDPAGGSRLKVLGPQGDGPVRTVRSESVRDLAERTVGMGKLEAVRHVAEEIERLDSERIAGVAARGIGTEHLFATRLRRQARWTELAALAEPIAKTDWRDVLTALGYKLERQQQRGSLATAGGRPVIVVHPKQSAAEFARFDEEDRLPEGALLADCDRLNAPFGILAAGSRLRLLHAGDEEAGQSSRYLELDAALIEPDARPLLGLLSPPYLAEGGFDEVLADARDYGAELRLRIDHALRQDVLPRLGLALGDWAKGEGVDLADDDVRTELEAASLTFVFRILFLLYAESAGHLPTTNATYRSKSMTRIAERAAEELDVADPGSTSLWRDVAGLVEAMRNGQRAWGVPPYNGALFAPDGFDGAEALERASISDAILAPALVALARDPDDEGTGVDFSGLEIGHLGHIYEGLLSLRLSVADHDLRYDATADRYVAPDGEEADEPTDRVRAGQLVWLTNEGGRKGGGVYYTRTELVRHLVRRTVRDQFTAHLDEVRALADNDPSAAAERLFDFYVLDPACGSAHFLVEVVDELADRIAELLGEVALPAVRDELEGLRAAAGSTFGAGIEDAALLKRLVLKRCVYGVDLSPMGAEIAKVSLWLATFVPGLSLAYLDHNVQVGNSLIGVARPEALAVEGEAHGTGAMFGDPVVEPIAEAAKEAANLRASADRTPDEVEASKEADAALAARVEGVERLFDLWTAEPLGVGKVRLSGTKDDEASIAPRRAFAIHAPEIVAGTVLPDDAAAAACRQQRALHWPLAFAEVFAREHGGFDVIVGNPPWEEVTVEELAFYARYQPGLRGMSARARAEKLAELKAERPELEERLEDERERLAHLRASLGPDAGYVGGAGDPDVYKYFCQRYRELIRDGGGLGVVLPRTVFLAKGSRGFREWLFGQAAVRRIDFLVNRRLWMFDTHPQYTVALLAAERRVAADDEPLEVAGVADSLEAFTAQSAAPGLRLTREALGPGLEVPLLPDQGAADLLAKLRKGQLFPSGAGRWRCFPVAELHETNDAHLWEGARKGRPLWKGESFDQFDPLESGAEDRWCPVNDEVMAKVRKPRPGAGSLLAGELPLAVRRDAVARTVERARVAFRDVSRATDSRTVRACLIPPEVFLLNSSPYLAFAEDDARAEAACLGLMNSFVFDWQARRFVENHLNFFVLEGLRLPSLDDDTFTRLARASARLSCVDDRFAEFAAAVGVECGDLPGEERWDLWAEIDALVARAWELTPEELEIVFSDFRETDVAAPPPYRELVREKLAALA